MLGLSLGASCPPVGVSSRPSGRLRLLASLAVGRMRGEQEAGID
jgi:hypothetical protein